LDASVAHQDIHPTIPAHGLRDRRFDDIFNGHIDRDPNGSAVASARNFLGGIFASVLIEIGDDNFCALYRKSPRDRIADASSTPGYNRYLSASRIGVHASFPNHSEFEKTNPNGRVRLVKTQ
jgi:hypothetical protein